MFELLGPLIVGLAGSLHCLGMCGPLVVAYSLHVRPRAFRGAPAIASLWEGGFAHHAAFHAGRLLTYGFLGMLASLLAYAAGFNQLFAGLRNSLTLAGGLLMVLFGLALLKIIPLPLSSVPSLGSGSAFGRIVSPLFTSEHLFSKFALGIAAGFLPCMLSWAMIVKAAFSPNPAHGFMTMLLFGLGTVPVLFFVGISASLLTLKVRIAGERVAACSVILMGLILLVKGAKYFA